MNKDIVFINNNLLGYLENNNLKLYSKEERNNLLKEIEKEVIKKDSIRRISSIAIASLLSILFAALVILMIIDVVNIGENQWTLLIFILALFVLAWVILYYLVGLVFYRSIKITYKFKKNNEFVYYASSSYSRFVNLYNEYVNPEAFKKEKRNVPLAVSVVKNTFIPVFSGKITSNIPYYYISVDGIRLMFLPGFIILVANKNSKVIPYEDFSFKVDRTTFTLFNKDKEIVSFDKNIEFNNNFFHFKFD